MSNGRKTALVVLAAIGCAALLLAPVFYVAWRQALAARQTELDRAAARVLTGNDMTAEARSDA